MKDTTYFDELRQMSLGGWAQFAASLLKAPWLALTNRKRFRSRYHRLLWLFRPYSVSCVMVRKPL